MRKEDMIEYLLSNPNLFIKKESNSNFIRYEMLCSGDGGHIFLDVFNDKLLITRTYQDNTYDINEIKYCSVPYIEAFPLFDILFL